MVELLESYGFAPHLVHPLRCKAIASARLKNDKVAGSSLSVRDRLGDDLRGPGTRAVDDR